MRRRLDLAASLITRPPLIFLDEPTTGLDPRTRGQMWETIRELVREGSTVLLTTQYLDEADQLADRIQVIDRGRTVAWAPPTSSSRRSAAPRCRCSSPTATTSTAPPAIVQRLLDEQAVPSPEARRLTVALPRSDRAVDVLLALREAGITIESVAVAKPSLDEVFLALTGHDTNPADDAEILEEIR